MTSICSDLPALPGTDVIMPDVKQIESAANERADTGQQAESPGADHAAPGVEDFGEVHRNKSSSASAHATSEHTQKTAVNGSSRGRT
jgi:hypothetical protein